MKTDTFILIPGLMSDEFVWRKQKDALGKHANIIIPDLSTANTPEAMVEAALLHAPSTFNLAGHSMGGWVALEIMRHAPERVNKLCLLNTTAAPDSAEKAGKRNEFIRLAREEKFAELIDILISAFVYRTEYIEPIKQMLYRNKEALISQEEAMLARLSCIPLLAEITCPTLIIQAENDKLFSLEDSQTMAKNIPNAKMHVIKNCGHMSPIEAADEVSNLLMPLLT